MARWACGITTRPTLWSVRNAPDSQWRVHLRPVSDTAGVQATGLLDCPRQFPPRAVRGDEYPDPAPRNTGDPRLRGRGPAALDGGSQHHAPPGACIGDAPPGGAHLRARDAASETGRRE